MVHILLLLKLMEPNCWHLLVEKMYMGVSLRIAVAENSSDVYFSYSGIDQRNCSQL